jgi:hypothetical protein
MDLFAVAPRHHKFVIPAMLLFGTCTTFTQKFMIEEKVDGLPEYGRHKFNKPWYFTFIMFIGMSLALAVYEAGALVRRRRARNALDEAKRDPPPATSRLRTYLLIAVPACCDLLATGIMNTGLLYINASAWQMLRGSMTVFSSILHRFVLKRTYHSYMWAAVFIVVLSLVIVGLAAVLSTGVAVDGASDGKVALAVVLTVGSQFIRACEIVAEDFLLHDKGISAVLIVGVKGMWGTILTGALVLPAAQWLFAFSEEGNGIHEDTADTLRMLREDGTLVLLSFLYVFFILGLNTSAMLVTNITNAVMRTIIECLRTLVLWIAQLVLFYAVIESSDYGHHHPTLGEAWSVWSWLQLVGFALLVTGMLAYNRTIALPFCKYERERAAPTDGAGSVHLSGSAITPLVVSQYE